MRACLAEGWTETGDDGEDNAQVLAVMGGRAGWFCMWSIHYPCPTSAVIASVSIWMWTLSPSSAATVALGVQAERCFSVLALGLSGSVSLSSYIVRVKTGWAVIWWFYLQKPHSKALFLPHATFLLGISERTVCQGGPALRPSHLEHLIDHAMNSKETGRTWWRRHGPFLGQNKSGGCTNFKWAWNGSPSMCPEGGTATMTRLPSWYVLRQPTRLLAWLGGRSMRVSGLLGWWSCPGKVVGRETGSWVHLQCPGCPHAVQLQLAHTVTVTLDLGPVCLRVLCGHNVKARRKSCHRAKVGEGGQGPHIQECRLGAFTVWRANSD